MSPNNNIKIHKTIINYFLEDLPELIQTQIDNENMIFETKDSVQLKSDIICSKFNYRDLNTLMFNGVKLGKSDIYLNPVNEIIFKKIKEYIKDNYPIFNVDVSYKCINEKKFIFNYEIQLRNILYEDFIYEEPIADFNEALENYESGIFKI
jgi:hypothetical protein